MRALFLSFLAAVLVACSTGPSAPSAPSGYKHGGQVGVRVPLASPWQGDSVRGDSLLMGLDFHDVYEPGHSHPAYSRISVRFHPCKYVQETNPCPDSSLVNADSAMGRVSGPDSLFADDSGLVTFTWVFGADSGQQRMDFTAHIMRSDSTVLTYNGELFQQVR